MKANMKAKLIPVVKANLERRKRCTAARFTKREAVRNRPKRASAILARKPNSPGTVIPVAVAGGATGSARAKRAPRPVSHESPESLVKPAKPGNRANPENAMTAQKASPEARGRLFYARNKSAN